LGPSTRTLLTGTAATVLGTGISAVMSMAYVSLGARWLGPERYGQVAVAVSVANLAAVLFNPLEVGLTLRAAGLAGRGELGALREFNRRSFRALLFVALGLWLVTAALGAGITGKPALPSMLGGFAACSLVVMAGRAGLRGRESFLALGANWVTEAGVRLGVGLGLVAAGAEGGGMIAGYVAGSAAAVLHARHYAQRGLPPATQEQAAAPHELSHPFRALSAPLLGLHLYQAAVVNLDMLVVGRFLEAGEAGLYGGAASLARIVLVAANPLLLVVFSRLAALSAARSDTRATLWLGAVVVVGGLALSMAVPLAGGQLLLSAFFGPAYAGAQTMLVWQWATACVLIAQTFFAESMLATVRVRGGALFALPCGALVAGLALFHGSGEQIAATAFWASASTGSLTLLLLWRWSEPSG
jgi:O-antigen/teichoic acid export membrane protein